MCYRWGGVISALKAGDEVIVNAGYGYPSAEEDAVEIIAEVDGFSAVTASGRRLMCTDGPHIGLTGNHLEEFEISPEAQKILNEVGG